MNDRLVNSLVTLRLVVGYLGERAQFAWWQSAFLAPASSAFLSPLFARTPALARCTGVTQAATLVHDDRIGVGDVYHLFRLPEDLEEAIHRALQSREQDVARLALVADQATALKHLHSLAAATNDGVVGPTWVGGTAVLRDEVAWRQVAGYYAQAFDQQREIFPYFADRSA